MGDQSRDFFAVSFTGHEESIIFPKAVVGAAEVKEGKSETPRVKQHQ